MRNFNLVCLLVLAILGGAGLAQSNKNTGDTAHVSTVAPSDYANDETFAKYQRVVGDMTPPKEKFHPDPAFPELPPDAESHGIVVMLVGVNAQGRVEPVRVLRSSNAAFEKAAVDTVKKWKFKPAKKDGQAVPVQITVEMMFRR